MTPKQKLILHLDAFHSRPFRRRGPLSHTTTLAELQRWHAEQHHRYVVNHDHLGPNRGPGIRPPGWKTGEGAVHR